MDRQTKTECVIPRLLQETINYVRIIEEPFGRLNVLISNLEKIFILIHDNL